MNLTTTRATISSKTTNNSNNIENYLINKILPTIIKNNKLMLINQILKMFLNKSSKKI